MATGLTRYGGLLKSVSARLAGGYLASGDTVKPFAGRLELFWALRALMPYIFGLVLVKLARVTLTHFDYGNPRLIWLNDMGALLALAGLALPLLLIIIARPRLSAQHVAALGYGSALLATLMLIAGGMVRLTGWNSDAVLLSIIALGYCAEVVGLYYWLQTARKAVPAQAVILLFASIMLTDILIHLVLGVFNEVSHQLTLLLMIVYFFLIASYRHRDFPQLSPKSPASEQPSYQGLFGLAGTQLRRRRVIALVALGVTLFTVSTGLLLGFVPKTYVSAEYASDPLAQLGALVIRELLTQSICLYFIWRAWQGRLWKLSIGMLQIIALLAFAVLPCSMLSHGGPIHLDTILTNSLYLLLTGLVGSLVIFFIGQEEAVENTEHDASPDAVVRPRRTGKATVAGSNPVATEAAALGSGSEAAEAATAPQPRPRRQRRPIGSIVYAIAGLYCCLLPRSFGRSVFFPLFDTENDFALFIIVFSDLLFVAVAAFLALCLRAAIDGRYAHEQSGAFNDAETPEDFSQLRLDSMRHSVAELGQRFKLSQRELEVLTLYALGYTQKRVASELFISPETVHTHIKNIYLKTNMCSRQKILDYLDKNG